MLPFLRDRVRTLTGVYVSWCFPAVFHHQTISHSKQQQKPSSSSPPLPPLPPLPSHYSLCSAFTPTKKKLLITKQRSVIKTHVYTRVSFMDQDLKKGEGGGSRHVSAVSTMSSSEQPSSVPSPLFWNIWSRPKTANNAAIQHVISQLRNRNCAIWRRFGNRSDKSSSRCKLIPWLLMERIFLIRPSCQDKSVYGCGEAHLCAVGSKKQKQSSTEAWVTGSRILVPDKLNTHQETGILVFPLVTMQFFSSGLIMVG